jgi:hypothetical protein
MTPKYLWVSGSAGPLDQFIPKFTNCLQHLMEVFVYCLNRPPKGLVHNSKPLIVPYNMQKHCHLLLY